MKPRLQPYGNKNICGANIERIRKEKKMTQGELAKRAGIDLSNMSKIEGQIRSCRDYELVAIAAALNVKMKEILK